jgi:hypothetical protein
MPLLKLPLRSALKLRQLLRSSLKLLRQLSLRHKVKAKESKKRLPRESKIRRARRRRWW